MNEGCRYFAKSERGQAMESNSRYLRRKTESFKVSLWYFSGLILASVFSKYFELFPKKKSSSKERFLVCE